MEQPNKIWYKWKEMRRDVNSLCREILLDKFDPDVIVGLSRGGLTPGVMMSHWMEKPFKAVKASLRDYPEWEDYMPRKSDERFIPNTFGLLVSEDKKIADGVKLWDTIVAINDNLVNNGVDLSDEVIKYEVGDTITLTIIRKKKYIKVDIELQVYEVPVETMYQNRNNPMGAPKT